MQQTLACKNCNREIENLCLSCMEQELIDWRPTLAIEFSEKASEFKDKIKTDIACQKCSSRVDICAGCFHAYIYSWLKDYDALLAEEFIAFFNIHS